MRIDLHAWIGEYPWRALPATGVADLLATMDAVGTDRAWVGSLPAAFRRDPEADNQALYGTLAPHRDRLSPVPTICPRLPGWERDLDEAVASSAPAVRAYPCQWGLDPAGSAMCRLAEAAAAAHLPLILTVQFEDVRQRHPLDGAPDLEPSAIRALVRAVPTARLLVAAARRAMIEEVHWGSTADESDRVWWEMSHLWGPPEDELGHLVSTIGADRFVFGSHWPLRVAEAAAAKLDLLEVSPEILARVEAGMQAAP